MASVSSIAPPIIHELVAKFSEFQETYKAEKYNETQLRRDFLDPFFKAMGWDIDNQKGYAEKFRDVIHEDAIRVEASVKAPDYCFRVGGQRMFFVEAKKPAVNIKDDIAPAFQLRRYAWTAKLPLSILTDFEELAVYDCRIKPDKNDKASVGRVLLLKYTDFVDRWHELTDIFSYDAINRGAFDKYAESNKKKRGTAEVDEAFLEEIEQWRESLAKNLSLRNRDQDLSERELNTAVQLIIDRIIFLRMCEGRGIEPFGKLQSLLSGEKVYKRLVELFHKADEKYNSGLFHFVKEKGREEPDLLTTKLVVDDKVLKDIIRRLYYPDSPYEFAAMPAEILGQVYEQFLGKVIRLTKGHQAKIEEKPEVRKAGGVYYTPKYIVDYIVENTVGKLLEGKTPQEVGGLTATWKESKTARPLSVLDPACGSGSFLIVAYQYLLDWYLKQYTEVDKPEKHAKGANPRIYSRKANDWRLTTGERKRILLSHIYGVDIDYQAVEVTKLSLLLKVLEGETEETLQRQLFAKERALPDLSNNIKCGNSLVGPDFYTGRQGELFDEEETLRINAFDWQAEFKGIFAGKTPGFDAVIGNPPYISIQTLSEASPLQSVYFKAHYKSAAAGNYDIYVAFMEKGIDLINSQGYLGFITPSKFFTTDYGRGIRAAISKEKALHSIADFKHSLVFRGVSTYTSVTILHRSESSVFAYAMVDTPDRVSSVRDYRSVNRFSTEGEAWSFASEFEEKLREKLHTNTFPLLEIPCSMSRGSSSGDDKVFIVRELDGRHLTHGGEKIEVEEELLRIPVYASDFGRYRFEPSHTDRIIFPYDVEENGYRLIDELELRKRFPSGYQYLRANMDRLRKRKQFKEWYSFSAPRNLDDHRFGHVMVPLLANKGLFCRLPQGDLDQYCPMASGGFTIRFSDAAESAANYVLGLLNSKLLYWRLQHISNIFRGGWITCTKQYVGTLPIRMAEPKSRIYRQISSLVGDAISYRSRASNSKTSHERTALERQFAATDREIDQLVYELYGLTDKEIALVEEATAEK